MKFDNLSALLQAREYELTAIYENVPGIVFYIAVEPDGEFRFLSVSRDFLTATGLRREHVVGCLVRDIIPPPARDLVLDRYRQAIRSSRPIRWEEESVYPAGQKYGEVAVTPLYDASGRATHLIGIVHDITERKRLEEQQLATVNERLCLAIESGSVGGWDWDIKSDKTHWFGRAHAHLGMPRDETSRSRQEFWDHVHQDDRERLRSAFGAAREKHEQFNEEFRVVWQDGTIHWLRSRGQYYYGASGEPERMLGISIDITESKKSEQALRDSEQRFHLAEQVGNMFSFDWDVTTDVVVRSPEHVRVLGLMKPATSSRQAIVDKIHPDDQRKLSEMLSGISPQNPTGHITYRMQLADGSLHWLKSSGRAFFDSQGRMVRVIGTVVDITDLKQAEEALAAMTRTLIESQEQERARIGRELHDDINQRLAMLSVELDQLREGPTELEGHVQHLRNELRQISDDIQAISHDLHSSKLEYLGAAAGIKSWCKEVAERHKIEVAFTNVCRSLPIEIGLPLFRILQEGVNNSIKHSGEKRIEVQLREDSGGIHLFISDSGKGFDVDTALRGKGLGLTSMRERVRLLNGKIRIESRPTGGTNIQVHIPLMQQSDADRLLA